MIFRHFLQGLLKGLFQLSVFLVLPAADTRLQVRGIVCIKRFTLAAPVFIDQQTAGDLKQVGAELGRLRIIRGGLVQPYEYHLG